MREALSQPSLSMAQNDVVSVEIRFLLLRLLVEISLRITWDYQRLVARGRKYGSALMAVMRKMLAVAAYLLRHEQEQYDRSLVCAGAPVR